MPKIELTQAEWGRLIAFSGGVHLPSDRDVDIFRAGLAAGLERAAKVFEQDPKPLITPEQAAAAIRALLQPPS